MKKFKKLRKRLPAIALAVAMCMGTTISAFAADPDPNEILSRGTSDEPAQVAITKQLIMPSGTTIPDATFTFQIEKVSVDDSIETADVAQMPSINDVTAAFSSADSSAVASNVKTVLYQTTDLLDGLTFTHAGEYVYKVKEKPDDAGYAPSDEESYIYSSAEYTLHVYVKEAPDGTLYVAYVGTYVLARDNPAGSTVVGTKVDATPGDESTADDYSKMIFTNTYTKIAGSATEDTTNSALTISKVVEGEYASKEKYFDFEVEVEELPSLINDILTNDGTTLTYKAFVVNKLSGAIVTSTENYGGILKDGTGGKYIEITPGTPITIKLKHNQKLAFTDMIVGVEFTVEEAGTPHYTASYSQTVNNGMPVDDTATEGASVKTDSKLIGEELNKVDFTNEYREITPTGVIVNNLPYVMILILAAGSFMAFIVVKSRKKCSRV